MLLSDSGVEVICAGAEGDGVIADWSPRYFFLFAIRFSGNPDRISYPLLIFGWVCPTFQRLDPRDIHDRLPRLLRLRHLRRRRENHPTPTLPKSISLLNDIHNLRLQLLLRRTKSQHRIVPY